MPSPRVLVASPSPVGQDDQDTEPSPAVGEVITPATGDHEPKPTTARAGNTAAAAADQDTEPAAVLKVVVIVAGDQNEESSSEVGAPGDSEFLSDAEDESHSEGEDNPSPHKKLRKSNVLEPQLADLHAEWNKWEVIFTDEKSKREVGTSFDLDDYTYSLKKLQGLIKMFPASDPRLPRARKLLAPTSISLGGKRTSDDLAAGQQKKARVDVPTQRQALDPLKKTQSATGNKSTFGPGGTSKALVKEAVDLELQQFHTSAKETFPDLDPKQLRSQVSNLKNAAKQVQNKGKLAEGKANAWLIRGMKTSLYDYQLDGVGWMLERERSRRAQSSYNPKGGILADEMGCGKTITMLAVIMANPPPASRQKDGTIRASLLLVQSNSMVNQWISQIEKHCEENSLATVRFSRFGQLNSAALNADQIVVMTYNEVERAGKKVKDAKEKEEAGMWSELDKAAIRQETLIFDTRFHRLILDECHLIKNHNSSTAKAVFELKSKIQWLISATPAPNREEEYYPYLKLLKLSNTFDLREFKSFWVKDRDLQSGPSEAGSHLEAGLERFQLRRTHNTELAGVRVFDGVPNSVEVKICVDLSDEERTLYNIVVERHRSEVAKLRRRLADKDIEAIQGGGRRKEAGQLVTRILQLHKLTAHPYLLEAIMNSTDFTMEQHVEVQLAMKTCNKTLLNRLFEFSKKAEIDDIDQSVSMSGDSQPQSSTSKASSDIATEGEDLNMGSQLDYSLGEAAMDRRCHLCAGVKIPIAAVLTEVSELH